MSEYKLTRALLSVYDKEGIVELAKVLTDNNVEIISTGGTYNLLYENNIKCIKIEDFTDQKEIFGGRVKTLHTKIHSGILSKRDKESDELNVDLIDLIVVNLYPFEDMIRNNVKNLSKLIEMIDIGGPTMLRAGAKNYKYVTVVPSSSYYPELIEKIKNNGIDENFRLKMAIETFRTTSFYDSVISKTLHNIDTNSELLEDTDALKLSIPIEKVLDLRYGENPHQKASYNSVPTFADKNISQFFVDGKIHGKELSYNNIGDISAAIRMLSDLDANSCVVIKHSNPCGAASRNSTFDSFTAAYEGDKVSIFGGIVGFKGILEKQSANLLSEIFLEIIIAESFTTEAKEILMKKKNIRLMEYDKWKDIIFKDGGLFEIKKTLGGVLIQERDASAPKNEQYKIVTKLAPNNEDIEDLIFAQTLVKHVKSNAIVVVKNKMLLGVGAGQMNRVTSARIALDWAGDKSKGAVMGSDAFFPMDDTVRLAANRGIKSIVQPGGSIKDEDSIKACDELGISMIFTGVRHFLH